jgi:hypothetical protein
MARKTELLFAWSGLAFVAMFFVGFAVLADFVPPPSPADSAEEIAERYREHADSIRAGLLLAFVGTIFFLAFASSVTAQTARIAGASPALRHLQVACVSAASLIIIVPVMIWWVAAFRPSERTPELVQALNDVGWMIFVVGFVPFVAWAAAVGLAILSDVSETPVFPRWAGYLSLLVAFVQVPPGLLIFFKTGPFAWDGAISWWLPMFDFFIWIVVILFLTVDAINRRPVETSASRPDLTGSRVREPSKG